MPSSSYWTQPGLGPPRILAYYADIDAAATGDDLKAQLHDLIDDHTELNYREL
ncbi:MAG: hypothetical protein KTR15_08545 [Phycisphaeraceae bacterium]|nr:hypothetical protein [Phycisphaeraceae bacterium]